MSEPGFLQYLAGGDEVGRVETELRVFAAAGRPFARTLAVQPETNADVRFDPHFFRGADCLFEFLEFFDNNDDRFAKLASEQRDPNKGAIFVTITDDEALRILVHGERGDQLRLTPGFQAEMKLLAGIDNFFDYFAQLIDLDRNNSAVTIAITKFGDRIFKSAIDRFDAVSQEVLKPNDERKP